MKLDKITQPFITEFPGDTSYNLMQRQTPGVLYALVNPVGFPNARLIHFNKQHAAEIGLGEDLNVEAIDFLNANVENLEKIKSYATAYAGHQFGNWAGQLGDGRAIFAGAVRSDEGKTTELQWKGAGATPYSRHADGRAVLRSTVREYLMSEAMYHLGIPTTRSLSMSFSGEDVIRDIMYSGNPKSEKGAVMMRTAPSFLRFGHFELVSAQKNQSLLQQLADFTIKSYFPEIQSEGSQKYIDWFKQVAERTADLMVEWYRVGFVHGVMNTDNMSVLGLTIDYGPFAMLEAYDLNFTPNTTDLPGRRYAFGEQGKIAQWNLWQLANTIFPLIGSSEPLQEVLDSFGTYFWQKHDEMLCRKFGFEEGLDGDEVFFNGWQDLMHALQLDYTLFFNVLEDLENFSLEKLQEISYIQISENHFSEMQKFLETYRERLSRNNISLEQSRSLMKVANPKFILRNYLLFECIEELNGGNYDKFNRLWEALQQPYEEIHPKFSKKRHEGYDGVAGCSMLSCSS